MAVAGRLNVLGAGVDMTDAEYAAFLRGFSLAKPPGPDEADALDRAEGVLQSCPGSFRVAIPKELARAFLAFHDGLPANEAAAAWGGFMRGAIAKTGAWPGNVYEFGSA